MNTDFIATVTGPLSQIDPIVGGSVFGGVGLLIAIYSYMKNKRKKMSDEQNDTTQKNEFNYQDSKKDDKPLWSNELEQTIEIREFDIGHKMVPKEEEASLMSDDSKKEEANSNDYQERTLRSSDLLEIAVEFDKAKDKKGACYYILEAFKIESNDKEKIRLRFILQQYKDDGMKTEILSDIINKLPTFYNSETNEVLVTKDVVLSENTEIDNLMSQIAKESEEQENVEDNSQALFMEEFSTMINDIHQEVRTGVVEEKKEISKPINQSIWVNWMLQSAGKASMKNSMLEIVGEWGTKSSVEQLKILLDKEAGISANGIQNTWSILSVLPLKD